MEEYLASKYDDISNITSKYGLIDKKLQTLEDISKKKDLGNSVEIIARDWTPGKLKHLEFKGSFKGNYEGPSGEKLSNNVERVECFRSVGKTSYDSRTYYVVTEGGSTYIFSYEIQTIGGLLPARPQLSNHPRSRKY